MGSPRPPVPTFYKGELVKSATGGALEAWRRATPEEREAWYSRLADDVRAGKDVPYDDGGESKLAPTDTYYTIPADEVMTIVRGRVNAAYGWGKVPDCCQIFCPSNGQTLFIKRKALTREW